MMRKNDFKDLSGRNTAWVRLLPAFLLCLALTFGIDYVDAQNTDAGGNLTIRGVVVDTKDPPVPLIGATVTVRGGTAGTITDESGFFSIKANNGDVLEFRLLGYVMQEFVARKDEANLSIALAEDVNTLDQVIVTGMSSKQKTQVAASVGVISNSNFENKPITRLSQALQGGTTGIQVSQTSGLPGGDGAQIKIRGVASLLGSDPLVLVDGFEFDLDKLDPATVESVSVLKDAAAASVYGAKAGNGVILVTTKRGTAGKVSVGYNAYFGIQQPLYMPDFVDAATYMDYMNVADRNGGAEFETYTPDDIRQTIDGTDPLNYPDTDWKEWTMRNTTPIHEHNIQVSGGNTTARFALSAQYMKQNGMYKFIDNGFERLAVRANTTINLTKTLYIYTDMFVNRDTQQQPVTANQTILDYIYRTPPTVVAIYPRRKDQDPDDDYVFYGNYKEFASPLLNLQRGTLRDYKRDMVSINARPTWQITKDLTFRGQVGYRLTSGVNQDFRKAYAILDYWTGVESASTFSMVANISFPARTSYWMAGATLDYDKNLGKGHKLNVIAGYSQEGTYTTASVNQIEDIALMSAYGKVYYSYQDRYLAEAGVRMDGSSLFGPGKKWGVFPSVALGWNIDKERFMEPVRFVDAMKLRVSYGILGNSNIPPYRYQSAVNSSAAEVISGNPGLTWEKVAIFDAGLDISLFKQKLDITFDVFRKHTTDLLVSIPGTPSSAFLSIYSNAGEAEVKGLEVGLGFNHSFSKDIDFSFNLGYSYNKTKLLRITNKRIVVPGSSDGSTPTRIYQQGSAINEYYGYAANGLLSQEDLDTYYPIIGGYNVDTPAQRVGDVKYVDMNGDGAITADDMRPIGSIDPESVYYMSLSFRWRNLDFEAQANGVGYVPVYYTGLIANPLDGDLGGVPQRWHLDYWTPENTDARLPRPTPSAGNNALLSTFWKTNGAFLRIRYIQLGYNLPWVAKKIRAENLRFYVNVQNPFTFTKTELIDPETKGTYSTHPMFKTYSIGLNIKF